MRSCFIIPIIISCLTLPSLAAETRPTTKPVDAAQFRVDPLGPVTALQPWRHANPAHGHILNRPDFNRLTHAHRFTYGFAPTNHFYPYYCAPRFAYPGYVPRSRLRYHLDW